MLHSMSRPPSSRTTRSSLPTPSSSLDTRLSRESSERERAQALLRRKQRERERELSGSATPSTVHGDFGGYGDVYNREEVEAAHRGWGRRREWGDDDRKKHMSVPERRRDW